MKVENYEVTTNDLGYSLWNLPSSQWKLPVENEEEAIGQLTLSDVDLKEIFDNRDDAFKAHHSSETYGIYVRLD
jgi:hypothetical protein